MITSEDLIMHLIKKTFLFTLLSFVNLVSGPGGLSTFSPVANIQERADLLNDIEGLKGKLHEHLKKYETPTALKLPKKGFSLVFGSLLSKADPINFLEDAIKPFLIEQAKLLLLEEKGSGNTFLDQAKTSLMSNFSEPEYIRMLPAQMFTVSKTQGTRLQPFADFLTKSKYGHILLARLFRVDKFAEEAGLGELINDFYLRKLPPHQRDLFYSLLWNAGLAIKDEVSFTNIFNIATGNGAQALEKTAKNFAVRMMVEVGMRAGSSVLGKGLIAAKKHVKCAFPVLN